MFRVGQKVVCVKPRRPGYTILPVQNVEIGEVYTIRTIYQSTQTGETCIHVEEIYNPISPTWGREYGFLASRFKPIITKSLEEDTSEFRKLLNVEPMDATMFLLDILDNHVMEE